MGLLSKAIKVAKDNKLDDKYNFEVAGFFAYEKDARDLYELNPQYKNPTNKDKKYYKYKYFEEPCELIPEPSNEHDKNAVAVYCKGIKVGHIPAVDCDTAKKCIKKNYQATISIRPGVYREYDPDIDEFVTYKKTAYAFVDLVKVPK